MVKLHGFTHEEENLVTGVLARFHADDFRMGELNGIVKADLPGYNGKVVPVRRDDAISMTMYLSCLSPFTVAHELAHVSDISIRRQETFDNLSLEMPKAWHLAHRMSSEYYANRIACDYAGEPHVFEAFQNDCNGMKIAVHQGDWASAMIHYALLLGIMHGMKRMDCEPLKLLGAAIQLPDVVTHGIEAFKHQAVDFFDNYATPMAMAA